MHLNIRKIRYIFFLSLFLIFILNSAAVSQWVSNPEKNTLLVTNCFNPVNISTADDRTGGLFLFWEDNAGAFSSHINFLHLNGDGVVSFRSDGKKISSSEAPKSNPVAVQGPSGSAYAVWRERRGSFSDQLYTQRVHSDGRLLWNYSGVSLSSEGIVISDFSAASDRQGNLFAVYVNGEPDKKGEYTVKLQGVTSEGRKIFKQEPVAVNSHRKKNNLALIPDNSGGAHIFWLESIDHKSVLFGQSIDSTGHPRWKKPVQISNPVNSVFSFNVKNFNSSSVYIVWQTQRTTKDIVHQIIDTNGKEVWEKFGKSVTPNRGNQTNPQVLITNSEIMLTWTDDSSGDRNVIMQKFNSAGKPLWDKNLDIAALKGDQFGQKITTDSKRGAVVTWLDRRVNAARGNIYAQRIDSDGNIMWEKDGIQAASHKNTEKSYISLTPDNAGGAVIVFKEKRNGKNEIYGHKVFSTGTFSSQIIALNSELEGDSVKVSWYSANELNSGTFAIERTISDADGNWERIGEIDTEGKAAAKYYEYYDKPEIGGTLYYRVVHSDGNGNIQPSDLAEINYFNDEASVFISQNSPNPFKDKTKINIYLPKASKVKIEFFDSRIVMIDEVVKDFPAGLSELEYTAGDLNPGIYFYKVHVGDFVEVKKMVVAN